MDLIRASRLIFLPLFAARGKTVYTKIILDVERDFCILDHAPELKELRDAAFELSAMSRTGNDESSQGVDACQEEQNKKVIRSLSANMTEKECLAVTKSSGVVQAVRDFFDSALGLRLNNYHRSHYETRPMDEVAWRAEIRRRKFLFPSQTRALLDFDGQPLDPKFFGFTAIGLERVADYTNKLKTLPLSGLPEHLDFKPIKLRESEQILQKSELEANGLHKTNHHQEPDSMETILDDDQEPMITTDDQPTKTKCGKRKSSSSGQDMLAPPPKQPKIAPIDESPNSTQNTKPKTLHTHTTTKNSKKNSKKRPFDVVSVPSSTSTSASRRSTRLQSKAQQLSSQDDLEIQIVSEKSHNLAGSLQFLLSTPAGEIHPSELDKFQFRYSMGKFLERVEGQRFKFLENANFSCHLDSALFLFYVAKKSIEHQDPALLRSSHSSVAPYLDGALNGSSKHRNKLWNSLCTATSIAPAAFGMMGNIGATLKSLCNPELFDLKPFGYCLHDERSCAVCGTNDSQRALHVGNLDPYHIRTILERPESFPPTFGQEETVISFWDLANSYFTCEMAPRNIHCCDATGTARCVGLEFCPFLVFCFEGDVGSRVYKVRNSLSDQEVVGWVTVDFSERTGEIRDTPFEILGLGLYNSQHYAAQGFVDGQLYFYNDFEQAAFPVCSMELGVILPAKVHAIMLRKL